MNHKLKFLKPSIMPNLLFFIVTAVALAIVLVSCSGRKSGKESSETAAQETSIVKFWNGNRSEARKVYEHKVLDAIMKATKAEWGPGKSKKTWMSIPEMKNHRCLRRKGTICL